MERQLHANMSILDVRYDFWISERTENFSMHNEL